MVPFPTLSELKTTTKLAQNMKMRIGKRSLSILIDLKEKWKENEGKWKKVLSFTQTAKHTLKVILSWRSTYGAVRLLA